MHKYFSFFFKFLFILLCFFIFAMSASAYIKLGVLPLRPASDLDSPFVTDILVNSLSEKLLQDLQEADLGEIIFLPWPEEISPEDRPNFETLVGLAREAGCNGVLAITLVALDFSIEEKDLPIVGTMSMGSANIRLTGNIRLRGRDLMLSCVRTSRMKGTDRRMVHQTEG